MAFGSGGWNSGSSGQSGVNTGDLTLAAVGSSPNGNAATLTGQVLNLELASVAQPGIVGTGAQTFAGTKTFSGDIRPSSDNALDLGTGSVQFRDLFLRRLKLNNYTTVQRDALTPVEGLVIYNVTDHKLQVYTTTWETITSA